MVAFREISKEAPAPVGGGEEPPAHWVGSERRFPGRAKAPEIGDVVICIGEIVIR